MKDGSGIQIKTSEFLKIGWIKVNLIVMTSIWLACSINYQLIAFNLKYLPGNVILNNTVSCVSEMVGNAVAGILIPRIGATTTFQIGFLISLIGGAAMLIYLISTDYYSQSTHVFGPVSAMLYAGIIVVAKFGVCMDFCACFSSTTEMFPAQFSVVAFGISNFLARVCTFFSPQIAEIQSTAPMWIFTILSLLNILASSQLRKPRPVRL
jgi:hypothetical protein